MNLLDCINDYIKIEGAFNHPYYIPKRVGNTPLGRVHDKDAHPQFHTFKIHGVEIQARNRKEAIKKYNRKNK